MASLYELVRLVHIVAAALWFGGAAFAATRYGPVMRATGPAAAPVLLTLLRSGGMSAFFAPAAIVTVLAGLYIYVAGGFTGSPAGNPMLMALNVGVLFGFIALALGMYSAFVVEGRMKTIAAGVKDQPSPEQGQQLGLLAAKAGKLSMIVLVCLSVAIVAMAGRLLFV